MLKEFKEFIARGNVIDLAVGVIIGGAFGKIVASVVNDLIMPLIGIVTGQINFANMFWVLGKVPDGIEVTTLEQATAANVPTLNYGAFLTNVLDFLIIALVIFFLVKGINKLNNLKPKVVAKAEAETAAALTEKECPYCCTNISIKATRCPHCTSEQAE